MKFLKTTKRTFYKALLRIKTKKATKYRVKIFKGNCSKFSEKMFFSKTNNKLRVLHKKTQEICQRKVKIAVLVCFRLP